MNVWRLRAKSRSGLDRPRTIVESVTRGLDDLSMQARSTLIGPDHPGTADATLERRIAQVRWGGILLGSVFAPFLYAGDRLWAVYLIIAVASVYNLVCSRLILTHHQSWILRAYAWGAFDIVLGTLIIAVTGGTDSPFYLVYFLVIVHAAIRFGRSVALLSSLLTGLCYTTATVIASGAASTHFAEAALRVGFLALTATFAGVLSDRARSAELALSRKLKQARELNVAGAELTGSLEWSTVLQRITEHGRVLAEADVAILEVRSRWPHGVDSGSVDAIERTTDVLPSGAYLGKVLLQSGLLANLPPPTEEQVVIADLTEATTLLGEQSRNLPRASFLRAPICVQDDWVGDLLVLRSATDLPFTPGDADTIGSFVHQASLTLQNAWLYRSMRQQATTDPVTGLPNHRSLKEQLSAEVARARQHQGTLSVLMLDLDRFKTFNDAFGHATGDEALLRVAETLRDSMGRSDYVARYGGEEFVIVLPDTPAPVAVERAERLRAAIAELADDSASRLPAAVTVSIGVAAFPSHGSDMDFLLQSADFAMYLAKHRGRNQVCSAGELAREDAVQALLSHLMSHLSLPTVRWGPHLVVELERRFESLASLPLIEGDRTVVGNRLAARQFTIEAVTALAATIDAKDRYTEGHSRHVSALGVALARQAGLADDIVELVQISGLLHDIGKIGIPESILNKPGPLNEEEWTVMRSHTEIGARILAPIAGLGPVIPTVRHHHERWDGEGYPDGLAGETIPIGARIIAICDAYDTMISARPYRASLRHADAVRRLMEAAGTQFDPRLVRAFMTCQIYASSSDAQEPSAVQPVPLA
jgi:diguanylate cyclase (GGDEF)-like protein/putative nucleotidyltransferase with HDIG domain